MKRTRRIRNGAFNMAISEAQKRATYNYRKKNRERTRYINKRSMAKSFILNNATSEDLEALKGYIEQRQTELDE